MESWHKRDNPDVIVEAIRLNEDNVLAAAKWSNAAVIEETNPEDPQETQWGLNINTPSGVKRATLGMYVVKFAQHFFVSHVRLFEEIYTPVERQSPPPESIADARRALGFADPFDRGRNF